MRVFELLNSPLSGDALLRQVTAWMSAFAAVTAGGVVANQHCVQCVPTKDEEQALQAHAAVGRPVAEIADPDRILLGVCVCLGGWWGATLHAQAAAPKRVPTCRSSCNVLWSSMYQCCTHPRLVLFVDLGACHAEMASVPNVGERLKCYANKFVIPEKLQSASKVGMP